MKRGLTYLLALCCFLSAAMLNLALTQSEPEPPAIEGIAPAVSSTPAINLLLGGFRGIVADWLWMRAIFLQDQGRYLELVQLSEWITALQPQFPDVWILQSWNLAYNISVLMPSADQRWPWIMHGLESLREQAAPATAFHPRICAETAWILMHKIGGRSDDFSDAYAYKWLAQQAPLLAPSGQLPPEIRPVAEAFGLPTAFLESFDDRYGPLDWRHPVSHAAAWASLGASLHPTKDGAIRCKRLFAQALRRLLFFGRIAFDPQTGDMILSPDFERVEGLLAAYRANHHDEVPFAIPDAYRLTLEQTIRLLVHHERWEQARQVFTVLQQTFPDADLAKAGFRAATANPLPYVAIRIPHPPGAP